MPKLHNFGISGIVSVNMLSIYKNMYSLGMWIHSVFHMRVGENMMAGNGKRWLVIGLAVMVGCMVPMGTMKASEEGESVSQNSFAVATMQQDTPEAEPKSVTIKIMLNSADVARVVGAAVGTDVEVCNNHDQAFVVTAEGSNTLTYYLDTDDAAGVRNETELAGLCTLPVPEGGRIQLSKDGKYVLYVKAVAENKATYAGSSCRVVVDTQKPVIEGIKDGEKYPVGQTFTVRDANDVTVTINEKTVLPDSEGKYTIQAQQYANNYVIKAKDIAGHWSDTVIVYLSEAVPEPEEPTLNTITESKTYILQEGTVYTLGAGSWKVEGDSSVYSGGITFYVPSGNYNFQKQ